MKKITLSIVSIMALSSFVIAGGDVAPVEEPVIVPVVVDESAFYVGIGMGAAYINDNTTQEEISSTTLLLQAGYQYNRYVAFEGRVSFGFNTDYDPGDTANTGGEYDSDISNWGIYVKPMYPVTEAFDVYALLGYGGVQLGNLENGDAYVDGFQWGLGVQYAVTESVLVFADYVKLYDDTGFDYRAQLDDVDSDTWVVGVSYRF